MSNAAALSEKTSELELLAPETLEAEDEYVRQFQTRLALDSQRIADGARRLKPNVSKQWLDKIRRTLEIWRLINNQSLEIRQAQAAMNSMSGGENDNIK